MNKEEKLKINRRQRIKVLSRIEEYEKKGGEAFFCDVEDDPPHPTIMPEDVDYMQKKLSTRIRTHFAMKLAAKLAKKVVKEHEVTVVGAENLKDIRGGAVITSNHFSPEENVAVWEAVKNAEGKRKFFKIIREGNYFFKGTIGYLLRNADTLPLSENVKTMMNLSRAVDKYLKEGNFVLVYPEKAMWWNYRKPRPFKIGAFRYAAKAGVPVVPCFITMKDLDKKDENGFPVQKYAMHIMPPIYPAADNGEKDYDASMIEKNFELVKNKYEEVYKIPLSYN
ncbi:MAG: 1-acyl-sn-glycerol-3-phosphate acyltransferase [Clostridia bacterium]|nr:1-acyl-sn-glycerol-3-phosphate acyltransferase [Clostridia bacterium]